LDNLEKPSIFFNILTVSVGCKDTLFQYLTFLQEFVYNVVPLN
jgi:hypothetical protein